MLEVQFYTLTGKFGRIEQPKTVFPTSKDALEAVKAYAEPQGFTDIRIVDNEDVDSIRFTGTTPGGRKGRNIAFGDWFDSDPDNY